ncbi:diguanylate cyclase domain-containing protein [Massilia sp. DWR3-1-1]|uniref:diguanylate cyclase domain-containing protein n=1 Tax=Massilia sp. DWR3-1-1 TaxID=2804559 RepID=UPI003CE68543
MSTFKHWGNLKTRIALAVAVLVFLAVALVTAASLLLAKRETRAVLGAEQYATLTAAGAYIDRDLDAKRTLLRLVAELMPDAILEHPAQLQALLAGHATLREEFSNIAAFDPQGNVFASLSVAKTGESLNVRHRDFFRDTVAYHEGVVSAPFLSRLTGLPVVVITQPIYNRAGQLKFIISGSLDLSSPRIFGQLNAVKPGQSGYVALLSGDGTYILHPDKRRLLARVADDKDGTRAATAAALRGFEGWTEGQSQTGVLALLTYRRLHTNDWIIASVYPMDEALAAFDGASVQALATALVVAVLAGLVGWIGISKLLSPLGALQRHVQQAASAGSDLEVFNVRRDDEFGRLSRAFYALSKKRQAAEAALAAQAMTDPLTGLSNRRRFDSAMALAFARAERSGGVLAIAYLDIDHFKAINDQHGHGGGDAVLIEFSRRLRRAVRSTDTVVRLAGDEFTVIFESFTAHCDPHLLGQKIIDAMSQPILIEGVTLRATASVGICAGPSAGRTAADFLRLADDALYRAKQEGRGRYALHLLRQDPAHEGAGAAPTAPAVPGPAA